MTRHGTGYASNTGTQMRCIFMFIRINVVGLNIARDCYIIPRAFPPFYPFLSSRNIMIFLPNILGLLFARGLDMIINPILQQNLPLVITALLLGVLLNVVLLWRGQWTTATRLVKIGVNIFAIGVFYLLIVEHTAWLTANGAGGLFTVFENFPENGDFSFETSQILVVWAFRLAFIVAFLVTIVDTVKLIYKLLRNTFFPASLTLPVPVEDKE